MHDVEEEKTPESAISAFVCVCVWAEWNEIEKEFAECTE